MVACSNVVFVHVLIYYYCVMDIDIKKLSLMFRLCKLVRNCKQLEYACHLKEIFHMVIITSVLLQITKFILTCFTVHSLYYLQIINITIIKIIALNILCNIILFCSLIGCFIMALVHRTRR